MLAKSLLKIVKSLLPVDVRRSKTPLLKLPIYLSATHVKGLHETVTWYEKHLAGWQTRQRGKKNKEITSFNKANILSFQGPLRRLPSNKGFFFSL